ncbi:oligosaccharide flippase family protein, partial [Lactobacillus rhamnosus]|nr:oligosaccharide flippase family protein [Lacticaseibacillus rhamnosus]
MNKYRTLLLNIGLFGINTVATKLITFLLVPLYTYYLSTKEFGITDMSLTVISLVLPIASMSISDAVLRFVIDDSNDQKSVVSYGLIVIGLSCAIVALLLPVLKLSVFGGLGNYSGYFLLMYVSTA